MNRLPASPQPGDVYAAARATRTADTGMTTQNTSSYSYWCLVCGDQEAERCPRCGALGVRTVSTPDFYTSPIPQGAYAPHGRKQRELIKLQGTPEFLTDWKRA